MKSDLDEEQQKKVFQEVFLENEWFDMAAKQYRKEYLSTKYLKLRNPMIVKSICERRSYGVAKRIFQLETILHKNWFR